MNEAEMRRERKKMAEYDVSRTISKKFLSLSFSVSVPQDEKTNKVKRSLSRYDSRLVKSCVELLFLAGRLGFLALQGLPGHYRIIFIASVPHPIVITVIII